MSDMPQECMKHLTMLANKSPHREICGFIMKGWEILKVDNVAESDYQFDMDPHQQLDVFVRAKKDIVGVYHSHPSGAEFPSDRDIWAAPFGMRYWIVTKNSVTEWMIKDGVASTVVAPVHRSPGEVRSEIDSDSAESRT